MTSKICVIIPAYNAEETIGPVVRGALKYVPRVLMADDGSTDRTAQIAAAAGARVYFNGKNRGKGHTLKVLFKQAAAEGFDAVISMDADGQHEPKEIPRFIEAHRKAPDNIIIGSRMREQDKIPRGRYNSMHVARFFISIAANQFVEDTQCGFRLYPLSLVQKMSLTQEKYVTESEILMKAGDMGAGITAVQIGAVYGDHVSHFKPVIDVGGITAYIISYLMVKFIIDGLSSDRYFSYSKNNFRDRVSKFKTIDNIFKTATVLTIMPATFLFWLLSVFPPPFIKNNYASIRKLDCGYFKITIATNMLPVILLIGIFEKLSRSIGFKVSCLDAFIQKHYPHLWEWN